MDENYTSKELEETTSKIGHLKDEIKTKIKTKNKKKEKSALLFNNDIKDERPKYFGKTKVLLYIGNYPLLILEESRKYYFNNKIPY